jgi:hypothetical protein
MIKSCVRIPLVITAVVVNQETYLGGGRSFGSLVPGTPPIVSRNLTPDRYGRPGGHSYA